MNEPERIAVSLTLGALLEVSGWPKPGNVHRTRDFDDTRFEHFLASAVAAQPVLREVAETAARGKRVPLGRYLYEAVRHSMSAHTGGNTNLGILLLDVLLASALARASLDPSDVRREALKLAKETGERDAYYLYRAIKLAGAGGMRRIRGRVPDVSRPEDVLEKGITMYEALQAAAHRDAVAEDWVHGLERSLRIGLRVIELRDEYDINEAVVRTFLEELAARPDTLIWRKRGFRVALQVSEAAREILRIAGDKPVTETHALYELDRELHEDGINPGSTADLLAAGLGYACYLGMRP
ncbi:triphosphoribosyl-dephospho-CoA synthase [Methanopyrus sp.]